MYRLASAATAVGSDSLNASYTYEDDLLKSIQTNSTTYNFTYGDFSQIASIMIGTRNLASYTYSDDANRYLEVLDYGNGDKVQYTYDDYGRLLLETFEDNDTVSYTYDNTGAQTDTLGVLNPLRYRGYVYDTETGLYYLQSRYYNPEWGRFINADGYVSTGQGLLGNNMFAYCLNNPIF